MERRRGKEVGVSSRAMVVNLGFMSISSYAPVFNCLVLTVETGLLTYSIHSKPQFNQPLADRGLFLFFYRPFL